MSKKNFIIKDKEGILFSKISGDFNKIHTDNNIGYNSIFGEKICHASLIIIKIFKILNLKKLLKDFDEFSINVKFIKHFSYEKKIIIKSKKKNQCILFEIFQLNELRASILLENKNNLLNNNFLKVSKIFNKKKHLINFYNKENKMGIASMLLCLLTKYVGTICPGKNSIINEININFNKSFNFKKNYVHIFSKKLDKRFSIILNKLTFQNYNIEFKTSERPKLEVKLKAISKNIKNQVNNLKKNVLIIGGSSGIGSDVLNILKINKKIKIFATYNINKIDLNDKNIIKLKLNIEKNIDVIKIVLKKFSPLIIYYFATPRINVNSNNQNIKKLYKRFYIDYPLKIISLCKDQKINFFYPSTAFLNEKNKSNYCKIKKIGETTLIKNINSNIKINICRIAEVNTKQNLSLIKKELPDFRDLLNKNKYYQKMFFFT